MSKIFIAVLAVMAPLVLVPIQAQAPAAAKAPEVDVSLAYVARLGEAMNVHLAGMKKLTDAKPLIDTMTSPAGVKAGAPKMRAVLGSVRSDVQRADAMLGGIVPPDIQIGGLTAAAMMAQARAQNAKTLALLDDYSEFLTAVERNDHAAARKAAPKLMEGSFLMIDGSGMMMRNRQVAVPADQSIHQALGLGVQIYRAMGAAGRGWASAKFGAGADAAALRSQLVAVAQAARALSQDGRANLQRELMELDRKTAGAGFTPQEAATMDRLRRAFAEKEKLFAIGDQLAGLADAGSKATGATLAAQPTPQLLGELAALETRFFSIVASQAAIASGKAQ